MDLVPKPSQLVSAAANLAHRVVYGGLADLRPMPRSLVDEGPSREVYHYRPTRAEEGGDPVLLVTPLAAPAICYDLRRGCSLVEHLVEQGRPTYVVEYGELSLRDPGLADGIATWAGTVVPDAVRAVSQRHGGRPVQLVGWSLGGAFGLLAAAGARLPVGSVAALGTPFDLGPVPLVAPPRPLLDVAAGRGVLAQLYRTAAPVTGPVAHWVAQQSALERAVGRPVAFARHLDDTDYLAQVEAVDRFSEHTTAYRRRTFGQLYHRFLAGDALSLDSLGGLDVPVLLIAGAADAIAPVGAVKAGQPLLAGAPEVRFEIVPGGHLGLLTGREARTATWPVLDAWLEEWAGWERPVSRPSRGRPPTKAAATKTAATKTAATKTAAKKTAAKKTAAKKAAAKKTAKKTAKKAPAATTAEEPAIGANRERRYGSAGSRALRR